MTVFTPNLSERKRILKKICREKTQWKVRITISIVLFLFAVVIMGSTAILLINHPTSAEGIFIIVCTGMIFACIPFFVSLSVKNTAKYKCGLPYSSYANSALMISDDTLEYIFWRVGPQEPAAYSSKRAVYHDEDKFVFVINRNEISSLKIQNDICTIIGSGKIRMPEWADEDRTVKQSCKEFSFILAFEEDNSAQTIKEWMG